MEKIKKKCSFRKNKTYEELYGKKRAKEIRNKTSLTLKKLCFERKKKSIFRKGHVPWNKDKKIGTWESQFGLEKAKEQKRQLSLRFTRKKHTWGNKISKTRKELFKNPKFKEQQIKNLYKNFNVKPNKPEKKLIKFFKEKKLPYKYVGNGDFILGKKCPDFINVNGEKKVIELFGEYWHGRTNRRKAPYHQTEQGTKEFYGRYGFKALIIWYDELKNMGGILEKIEKFGLERR